MLGLIFVQPILSSSGMMDTVRLRSVSIEKLTNNLNIIIIG